MATCYDLQTKHLIGCTRRVYVRRPSLPRWAFRGGRGVRERKYTCWSKLRLALCVEPCEGECIEANMPRNAQHCTGAQPLWTDDLRCYHMKVGHHDQPRTRLSSQRNTIYCPNKGMTMHDEKQHRTQALCMGPTCPGTKASIVATVQALLVDIMCPFAPAEAL